MGKKLCKRIHVDLFYIFRAFVMHVAIHHCESVRARTQFELDRLLDEVNPEARM